MKYQVRFTAKARRDVDEVLRWFADNQSASAGSRWLAQLLAKIDTLEMQPSRCSLAAEGAELGIELRELLFGRRRGVYRILFTVRGRAVNVLHIRHSARDAASPEDI